MNARAKSLKVLFLLTTIVALLLGPTACKPPEQDLPFQTIVQDASFPSGRSYSGQDHDFLVIAEPGKVDAPDLGVAFPSELAQQLRAVDYQHSFGIVVFWGLLGGASPLYTIDVLRVFRQGEEVTLMVHFGQPAPRDGTFPAFSSPYRVLTVSKEGAWAQNIRFVLAVDGQEVKEHDYFVP